MKNTLIKILNIILSVVSVTNFFLLVVTMGVWMKALDETLLTSAVVAGTHKISVLGVLYGVILAFFVSVMIGMVLIKKKNVAEVASVIVNSAFLGGLAIYLTANVSGFAYVFAGLSLVFSILMTIFMVPKEKKQGK